MINTLKFSADKPLTSGLVSAIIPSYNYGHFICEAIDSILKQSYEAIEIIVVDDGSTDDTQERLKKYGTSINCIHKENAGLSAARNTGIDAANGEFLAFLDADDIWHLDKIEKQVALARATGNPVVLCTRHEADKPFNEINFDDCFFHPSGLGSNALVSHQRLLQVGGFDEELRSVEDREMMLRLTKDGAKASLLHGNYSDIRVHGENMSDNPITMEENYKITLEKIFEWPEMKGKNRLKMRAKSYMYFDSIYTYLAAGYPKQALHRCLMSFIYWPCIFGKFYPRPGLIRTKLFLRIILSKLTPHR